MLPERSIQNADNPSFPPNKTNTNPLRVGFGVAFSIVLGLLVAVVFIGFDAVKRHKASEQQWHTYQTQLKVYQTATISPDVQLYAPDVIANTYKLVGVNQEKDAAYSIFYATEGGTPSLELKGLAAPIPANCQSTTSGKVQQNQQGGYFSCNIVIHTGGQDVYGYRELTSLRYQGVDPAQLTGDQLRSIQPTAFYIRLADTTVALRYMGADQTQSLLVPAAVSKVVEDLQPLEGQAREAFIARYIKPQKPSKPSAVSYPFLRYALALAASMYAYIFLFALMRLFAKSGRRWWYALVPVYDAWVLFEIAEQPPWRSLLFLLPAPFSSAALNFAFLLLPLGPLILMLLIAAVALEVIFWVLLSINLSRKFGKSTAFSLLLMVPPMPGFILLGLGRAEYEKTNDAFR